MLLYLQKMSIQCPQRTPIKLFRVPEPCVDVFFVFYGLFGWFVEVQYGYQEVLLRDGRRD